MSRVDELKKQYPHLTLSIFDVLVRMDPSKSKKYLALLCKIFSKRFDLKSQFLSLSEDYAKEILNLNSSLISKGISTNGLNESQIHLMSALTDFWNNDTFNTFKDFIYYVDKKKIKNNDVTSYNDISEMRNAISLAVMNELDKEMSNQVIKEHEDETWVAVRPLTFSASARYGASTRWCTTYQKEKNYFERYWRTGILVYFINKKTGYKFAGFKAVASDNELSFWNSEDQRVDFLNLDIEDYLFSIVRKIFSSTLTNKNLSSEDIQNQVHEECLEHEKLHYITMNDGGNRLTVAANGHVGIDELRVEEPEDIPEPIPNIHFGIPAREEYVIRG